MASRRPATAVNFPYIVLPLRSKPVKNPLLATPSRPSLVPRRPSCLRFTATANKAKPDLPDCLTQRAKSYTLLTTTYERAGWRAQTCTDTVSEDSSVMVDTEELEEILRREDEGIGMKRPGEAVLLGKTITLDTAADRPVLKKQCSHILRSSWNMKRKNTTAACFSGPLALSPRLHSKPTRMAVITNTSFDSTEISLLDRETVQFRSPPNCLSKPLTASKPRKRPISGKVNIFFPIKLPLSPS